MITPKDIEKIEMEKVDFAKLEKEIDESIIKHHGYYAWEAASLVGEYPVCVRDALAKRYRDAGWRFIYHHTSSENGERPGLTEFRFSMSEIDNVDMSKFHCVC